MKDFALYLAYQTLHSDDYLTFKVIQGSSQVKNLQACCWVENEQTPRSTQESDQIDVQII